ncbi:hypothetical protein PMAYCL1PPCAC_16550, partial [Pristionchus mayeri]
RLTPAYLFFIGFIIAWTPELAPAALPTVQNCVKSWWRNALYINNFGANHCYGVTWYLAVDMQFYCVAPIALLAIQYSVKRGYLVLRT